MLSLAFLLVLVTAVCIILLLPLKGLLDTLIAVPILMMAQIVLLTQILSELHLIGELGYAIGHLLILIVASGVLYTRRKRLIVNRPSQIALRRKLRQAVDAMREHWWVTVFTAIVLLYITSLVMTHLPQTAADWDALVYHFPRAYFWLESGTAQHFPTDNFRMTEFPPNASFIYAWILAFDGLQTIWLAVPQLVGAALTVFAMVGLARAVNAPVAGAVIAGGLFLLLPNAIEKQYFTGYIDLIVSGLVTSGVYFAVASLNHTENNREHMSRLCYTGICVGLAIGTKLTALVVLFVAGSLLSLYALQTYRLRGITILRQLTVASLIGFLVLGSYNYVLNFINYGNPISSQPRVESSDFLSSKINILLEEEIATYFDPIANFWRYVHQMADWNLNLSFYEEGHTNSVAGADDATLPDTPLSENDLALVDGEAVPQETQNDSQPQIWFDSFYDQLDQWFALDLIPHYRRDVSTYGLTVFLAMLIGPLLGLARLGSNKPKADNNTVILIFTLIPWLSLVLFSILLAYSVAKLRIYLAFVPFTLLGACLLLYGKERWRLLYWIPLTVIAFVPVLEIDVDLDSDHSSPEWFDHAIQELDDWYVGMAGEQLFAWLYIPLLADNIIEPRLEDQLFNDPNIDMILQSYFDCSPPIGWSGGLIRVDEVNICWFIPTEKLPDSATRVDDMWIIEPGFMLSFNKNEFRTTLLPEMVQADADLLVQIEYDGTLHHDWFNNTTCNGQVVDWYIGYRHLWYWFPHGSIDDLEAMQQCTIHFNRTIGFYSVDRSLSVTPREVRVYPDDSILQPPAESNTVTYNFGEIAQLNSIHLPLYDARQCATLEIQSWWTPQLANTDNYRVTFVLADQTGSGQAQSDGLLGSRPSRPTDQEGLLDWRAIEIPCDLELGSYNLLVGLYDASTVTNQPITTADGAPLGNLAYLTTITVTSKNN